ncbi:MAG: ABC transporter substrate-binding protein [Burkholderiaceae bacterium]
MADNTTSSKPHPAALPRRQALHRLAAGGLLLSGAGLARAQSAGRIVLGQSAAFTGPAAQLGIQMNQGARLAFDAFNAGGGLDGRKIDLQTLDDGYDPARCKANTEKFLASDVFALFGYVGTPTSLAALPLVKENRTPFFGPFTGAMALREPHLKQVFHVRASYDDETALIVKQLTSLGLNRVAVFRQNDAYGQAGLDGVNKALKALGLEPVAVSTVERNSVDVATAVKAIVPAKPDAIVQISAYKSCAAFIREARKAGYGGTFYNVSFVGTQALADELGREAHGVVVSQVMPYPYTQSIPITREYLAAIKAANDPKVKPNYSSMEGFIAARTFIEGLRRAKSASYDAFVGGVESLQGMSLGGFTVNFGPHAHVASRFVELSMLTEDGGVRR